MQQKSMNTLRTVSTGDRLIPRNYSIQLIKLVVTFDTQNLRFYQQK